MKHSMNPAIRWFRHLFTGTLAVRRAFPKAVMDQITEAVRSCESRHAGEIRVVIEAALEPRELWSGLSPRERALDVFSRLRVWDTEHNNGVLIYLLLAEHRIEIVADRGLTQRVAAAVWQQISDDMGAAFKTGDYPRGLQGAVDQVGALLVQHFPADAQALNPNELSNRPDIR